MLNRLLQILSPNQMLCNEPMSNHTSFKIGGPADFLLLPESVEQIVAIVKEFNDTPLTVIGNGSNFLVSDHGITGIVVKIAKNFSDVAVLENKIVCQSGALLKKIGNEAYEASLAGFEFASGIPGTVGGAIYMNAGAYGGEMKDVVESTKYIDKSGNVFEIDSPSHNFGYRKSFFTDKDCIILESRIKLQNGDKKEIKEKTSDYAARRADKQPLSLPSAGSTFKRPEGHFAGKLIQDAGLAGSVIGGAQVSEKHCGFIVNKGGATAADVKNLIDFVTEQVYKKFEVKLEAEVKIL